MSDESPFNIEAQMQQFARDHRIIRIRGDSVSRLRSPRLRFLETVRATGSGQDRPSYARASKNHYNRGWKVKRRLKLSRRYSSQEPSNVHAPRKHRSRGWKARERSKLASRHHRIHGDYVPSEASGQSMISSPPLMHFMIYVPPLLLTLVVLKYQGKPEIIFRKNPSPMWCSVVATSVYWLIVGVMKQMTILSHKYFQTLSHAALASGIFSTYSLVSIILPYPFPRLPLPMLISLLVFLALLYACSLFLRGIEYVMNIIHGIIVWARGCNLTEEASSPV